jgi:hypothetical protein
VKAAELVDLLLVFPANLNLFGPRRRLFLARKLKKRSNMIKKKGLFSIAEI